MGVFVRNISKIGMIALLGSAVFLAACKEAPKKEEKPVVAKAEFPRQETLYIGGFDWAPPTTFNPLDYDPNFPIDGNVRLMYETLVTYNQLSGELEPMLADSYTTTDSSISVHLDSKAKWNNGTSVTAEDVLFTFQMDSILPTPRHGNWSYIASITADTAGNIEFLFTKKNKNPLIILNAIAETSILPKSVFEPLLESAKTADGYDFSVITAFKNDFIPVVSGPYNLKSFSPDKIVLERDSAYWGLYKYDGKLPAPKFIIHTLYNGNNHFNTAMTKGNLDISSIFLPRIWDKAKDSIRAWSREEPYHQPGSITTLIVAVQNEPLNDVAFRQALTHAINFSKIKTRAVSNYTPTIQNGFILPFGTESRYFNREDAVRYNYAFEPEKAKKILSKAGYSWNAEGLLINKKKEVVRPISIECPSGWTDWEDAIKVVVESFKEIGIQAEEKFVDYSVWDKNLRLGTFDLSMKTQTAELSAASPWNRFNQIMGSGELKPVGEDAFANQGRVKVPAADRLLARIPTLSSREDLRQAYYELNRIFMDYIPAIPIMYRPTQYYQFSTKHWTNFPTEENPYAPPQNLIVAAGVKALWKIKPVQ